MPLKPPGKLELQQHAAHDRRRQAREPDEVVHADRGRTQEREQAVAAAAAAVTAGGRLFRLSVDEPSLEAIYTHYFDKMAPQGDQHAA